MLKIKKDDEVVVIAGRDKGKRGEVKLDRAQTAEMWMRNIQTSPAQMLQRRFALEDQQREAK